MSSTISIASLILVFLLSSSPVCSFLPVRVGNVPYSSLTEQNTALRYQIDEDEVAVTEKNVKKTCVRPIVVNEQVTVRPSRIKTSTKHSNGKKPTIIDIQTLDDLKYFLEDDERIAVIK